MSLPSLPHCVPQVEFGPPAGVGFSVNPRSRMYGLRSERDWTKCPVGIQRKHVRMEGQVAADKAQEYEFHRQFAHECVDGTTEWYPLGGAAHYAFQGYLKNGLVPPVPEKPKKTIQATIVGDVDPLENAIWILETRKIDLKIQWHRGPMTQDEINAWSILDSASEYLCKQL